jgi:hypothetical protein
MNAEKKLADVFCEVAGNEIFKAYKLRVNSELPHLNAKSLFRGFFDTPCKSLILNSPKGNRTPVSGVRGRKRPYQNARNLFNHNNLK